MILWPLFQYPHIIRQWNFDNSLANEFPAVEDAEGDLISNIFVAKIFPDEGGDNSVCVLGQDSDRIRNRTRVHVAAHGVHVIKVIRILYYLGSVAIIISEFCGRVAGYFYWTSQARYAQEQFLEAVTVLWTWISLTIGSQQPITLACS